MPPAPAQPDPRTRAIEPRLTRLASADDPRAALFRNQKDAWLSVRRNIAAAQRALPGGGTGLESRAPGLFMAEGELVVRQLAQSPYPIHAVLLGEARLASLADLIASLPEGIPVLVAPGPVVAGIVGFDLHRGVLAAGVRPEPGHPSHWTLDRLIDERRTLIVLEDTANHDNIGAIFRNASALVGAGRAGVVLSPRCVDPLYRKALRVSIGQALRVPFAWTSDWPADLDAITRAGYRLLAMTPSSGSGDLCDLPTGDDRPLALLLGAEGPGLTQFAMDRATHRVRIPIDPAADSLNLATAAAVALAHLARPEPS